MKPLLINSLNFIMIKSIVIFLALSFAASLSTSECHYSCSVCMDSLYSSCTTCADGESKLQIEGYQSASTGACADLTTGVVNVCGILLLIGVVISCSTFANQEIVHFVIFIQSMSMLYLVQVLWAPHTHYVLSSFTYLMILTRIQYVYTRVDGDVYMFKSQLFFKNTNIVENGSLVLAANGLLVTLMLAIPVFKIIRKKINPQRTKCLPDASLDRILTFINFLYLMLIQQTLLTFYFSLSFGQPTTSSITLFVLYFLSLAFFVANQWYSQFTFFRTRLALFNILLAKTFTPLFIISQRDQHYILLILLIVFNGLDAILTNKNRNNSAINRLLYYKIYCLVVIIVLLANYMVESTNRQSNSQGIAIVSTLFLLGIVYFLIMETVIQWKNVYCNKPSPQDVAVLEQTVMEIQNEQKQTICLDFNNITVEEPYILQPNKELTQSNINEFNQTQENTKNHPQQSPKYSNSKINDKDQNFNQLQIQIKPSMNNNTEPQIGANNFVADDLYQVAQGPKVVRKGKKRKHKNKE